MEVRTERIKAIATIVITAAVNIANVYGYAIDAEPLITGALSILSFATILWSWWKNQNVTDAAVEGQKLINSIKSGE